MSVRHGLIALGAVAALALSGCASSIAGAPLAAEALPAANAPDAGTDAGGTDADGLPVPSDLDSILGGLTGEDGSTPDLSDLEGLLGDLGGDGSQLPDLSQLDLSQLEELLSGLGDGSAAGDINGLLEGLGSGGVGALSPACLQVSGALMSVGFLLMGPALGTPLTSAQVDDAFKNLNDMPSELAGDISVLHQAAQSVVGKDGATATQVLSSPEVNSAMDHLSQYLDASCGGS